ALKLHFRPRIQLYQCHPPLENWGDATDEKAGEQSCGSNESALRGGFSIGFNRGLNDLDDRSLLSLVKPSGVVLPDDQIEEGLAILHFVFGTEIIEPSRWNVAEA